ncbi:MAG: homoserine dehydrogenase [Candidatus Omnitrophota bacterium]
MNHRLALVGFGTVGQGLAEILLAKTEYLQNRYGVTFDVVGISDIAYGTVYHPNGLNLSEMLECAQSHRKFSSTNVRNWDALTLIRESNATVVCELTFTDLQTGEPAISHCKAAFETGKHVVTSNKGPAALAYRELKHDAKTRGLEFLIEGTVMSGTPLLNLAEGPLAGCEITAARGILNGTTNYILTQMERGMSYEAALKDAQKLGYAEADPTADVQGDDARAKVTILANAVMGIPLTIHEVSCQGITQMTSSDIETAKKEGYRWKLIGTIKKEGNRVTASVAPEMLPLTHPLAGVMGAVNALTLTTDLMGDITIVGAGAGRKETGFSVLTDLLRLHCFPSCKQSQIGQ